jgi:chromosome segregation ATPase
MNKDQKQVIKDAIENLQEEKDKLSDFLVNIIKGIEDEKEKLEGLKEDLDSEHDDLENQESTAAEKLSEEMDNIDEIINELESLISDLKEDPFETVTNLLKELNK